MEIKNYGFLGGTGLGAAGFDGVLGVNCCFGVWWLPCKASPKNVLLTPWTMLDCACWLAGLVGVKLCAGVWPLKFSLDCFCDAGAGCVDGTNGCFGVWCVRFIASPWAGVGLFDSGVFLGGFI